MPIFDFLMFRRSTLVIVAFFYVGISLLGVQSCKHTPDVMPTTNDTTDTTGSGNNTSNCDPDSVYFENDILPLITGSCAYSGCHDAASHKDGVVLDSYENIMNTGDVRAGNPGGSELYEVLVESDPRKVMPEPPNAPFTQAQKDLVRKWIAQGAQNNKCTDCDTTDVSFASQVMDVMNVNCNMCHSKARADGGVILDTYTDVKKEVDNGKLVGVINHKSGFKKMPLSGIKMADCDIRKIEIWINNGALNN